MLQQSFNSHRTAATSIRTSRPVDQAPKNYRSSSFNNFLKYENLQKKFDNEEMDEITSPGVDNRSLGMSFMASAEDHIKRRVTQGLQGTNSQFTKGDTTRNMLADNPESRALSYSARTS